VWIFGRITLRVSKSCERLTLCVRYPMARLKGFKKIPLLEEVKIKIGLEHQEEQEENNE